MKRITNVLVMLILCLSAAGAAAQQADRKPTATSKQSSAEEFVDLCQYGNEKARVLCGNVVNSLLNAYVMMAEQDRKLRTFCPQRKLTDDESRRAFLSAVERIRDVHAQEFPDIVIIALKQRYPCTDLRIKR